jgi:hypothetical protein
MAFVCESFEVINGLQTCAHWIEQNFLLDELRITKSQMLMFLAPIVSTYIYLIGFKIFNKIKP